MTTKKDDFCVIDLTKDVSCERGTKGCDVDHTKPVSEKYAAKLEGREIPKDEHEIVHRQKQADKVEAEHSQQQAVNSRTADGPAKSSAPKVYTPTMNKGDKGGKK
jgi:hypothetical protein